MRLQTVPLRNCKRCHVVMIRQRRPSGVLEKPTEYRKREYCGNTCRSIVKSRNPLRKYCRHCGAMMRKPAEVTPWVFSCRVFCDDECRALYQEEHREEWREKCRRVQSRRLRDQRRAQCEHRGPLPMNVCVHGGIKNGCDHCDEIRKIYERAERRYGKNWMQSRGTMLQRRAA